MNHRRGSTDEGIWIALALVALLLLACGGGFMWLRQQTAAQAVQAAQMEARAAEMAHVDAQVAMERARIEAMNSRAQAEAAAQTAIEFPDSTSGQPLIPELYLNQDLWRHVESLADADPDARVFTLDAETGDVTFGDGQHGAAIPEAPATIQATYRTGGGGTVTVYLPETDLRESRLRAVLSPDGVLRLEVADPKPDD